MVTRMVSSQLKLLRLNTGREVPVIAANRLLKQHLFKYQVNKIHDLTLVELSFFYILFYSIYFNV